MKFSELPKNILTFQKKSFFFVEIARKAQLYDRGVVCMIGVFFLKGFTVVFDKKN